VVRKTWAPVGRTPILRHSYRHDKVSVISALTISPQRQCVGLHFRCHRANIAGKLVLGFVRHLLRHLRGPVVLLWVGSRTHGSRLVRGTLARHQRLHLHRFPAYAPELNPDEYIWSQRKRTLANSTHSTVEALEAQVSHTLFRLQHSPNRL
jgi:transposase